MKLLIYLAAVLLSALPLGLFAAESDDLTIDSLDSGVRLPEFSILIAAPGDIIYELEGHAALRIKGGISNNDNVVNWGLFDFSRPNFVYRFVKGETDYRIGLMPTNYFLLEYAERGRRVTELHLDLTEEEKIRLLEFIGNELIPPHNIYRYNYVKDNCATRPVRAVEYAVGLSIDSLSVSDAPGNTFREMMRYYHRNYPWYQFGIDLALGSNIDRQLDAHEHLFAPVHMPKLLSNAVVRNDSTEQSRKIVDQISVIVPGKEEGIIDDPTPWFLTPIFIGWLFFAIGIIVTVRDQRNHKVSRWFDSILYTIFGIAGLIVTYLVFVSVHEATSPNWILAWLNPISLIVGIGIWLKKSKKAVICAQFINFGGSFVLCIVGVASIQSLNVAFWPLILLDLMRSVSYLRITKW